jgi:hypothetical protein
MGKSIFQSKIRIVHSLTINWRDNSQRSSIIMQRIIHASTNDFMALHQPKIIRNKAGFQSDNVAQMLY